MKSYLKILFLFLIIFGSQTLEAQTKKDQRIEKREIRKARKDSLKSLPIASYFTIDLLKLLPTDVPRLNIGYIYNLNNKWFVGSTIGYGTDDVIFTNKEEYSLFEIRPQLLYNLGQGKSFHHFLSVEMFYINHKEVLRDRTLTPVNNQNGAIDAIAFDLANFKRTKYGFTLNYGEYTNFSNRLALRTIIGGGIRFKDNVYTGLVNARATESEEWLFRDLYNREGFNVGFEFNFSLQLIYKLN